MRRSVGSRQSFDGTTDQGSKLDEEFVKIMLDIEKHYSLFSKHDKIRIEQWSKKLCQITQNPAWQQNRNNYALLLLNCVSSGTLKEPFNKVPPENSLPALNRHIVRNRVSSVESKQNKGKADSTQKPAKGNKDPEHPKLLSNMFTPSKKDLPLKSIENTIETRNSVQSRNLAPRGSITLSEQYATNPRQSVKLDRENMSQHGCRKMSTDDKELAKLKAELELSRITLQNVQSELEIKNITIAQLSKKVETVQNSNNHLQNERVKLVDLMKIVKKGIDNQSITFTDKTLAKNFLALFHESCLQFCASPIDHYTGFGNNVNSVSSRSKMSIESPGYHQNDRNTRFADNGFQARKYDTSTSEKHKRIQSMYQVPFSNSKDISVIQRTVEDFALDETNNYLSDRTKTNSSNSKSPHSNIPKQEESKYSSGMTDRGIVDFLESLQKFQKDNEKLKKETEELLARSTQV